jgi:hypothetical protein
VQQVHTAKTSVRETTGRATEAVSARDDRRHYRSCRHARRLDALRKLLAHETTAKEAAGLRDKRAQERTESDKR